MLQVLLRILLILGVSIPSFSYADEGFIGNALGLDFYSKIDDESYSLVNQMVNTEMKKKPKLGEFGK